MRKIANKKLRKKRIWPAVILFLAAMYLGMLFMIVAIDFYFTYMMENKYLLSKQIGHMAANGMVGQLENGKTYDEALDWLSRSDIAPPAACIIDEAGTVVASYGKLTVDLGKGLIQSKNFDMQSLVSVYADIESPSIMISLNDLVRNIADITLRLHRMTSEDWNNHYDSFLLTSVYDFSYWDKVPLQKRVNPLDLDAALEKEEPENIGAAQGKEFFVVMKFDDCLSINDALIIILSAAIILLLFSTLLTIQFINTIVNIVSQRRTANLLLQDDITGGNNFLAFTNFGEKQMTSSRMRGKNFALVDFSILKFQSYCSLYGVQEGDRFLSAVNKYLTTCHHKRELHARISNADYAFLLQMENGEDAEQQLVGRVQKIMQELPTAILNLDTKDAKLQPAKLQGINNIKMQAGIYLIPQDVKRDRKTLDLEQLFTKASTAKASITEGAEIAVYNHEMWEKEMWEQKVEDSMREALANEEFQVYIQPKYNPVTKQLAGGEALVRWISPSEGFISPGKFIPIFEKTGFITHLDDYMISHTAALQAGWLEQGKKIVPISVNVSRAHFAQPDLAEHICELVDHYGLPHEYLEIELTESAFFDDKNALLTTVKKLQAYGFEVSMDDFGSGYSSLNSLKDLPLNVLKLDAEFFRGDDFDTRGEIVVSKAIALARQLNMRIVAEGVEKKEQVDFLAEQECDMIQGFYFAKPMPASEYESRMDAGRADVEGKKPNTEDSDVQNDTVSLTKEASQPGQDE